jgi:signal transduction histidine kinase
MRNLLLALYLLAPATQAADAAFESWLFRAGDDPSWKAYAIDESKWQPIEVPGSWQAQGFESRSGVGWYRAHLRIDAVAREGDLGVALGRIYNADQVFFNGMRIGAEGHIGEQVVEAHAKTRVYRIPRSIIHYGGDNVLAVRVKNTHPASGIVTGPIAIGDYSMLSMEAEGVDSSVKVFQGMVIGLFLVLVLFSCFLYLNGLRDRTNLYFGLFLVIISAATFLDSLYFYDLGLKTPLVQRIIYALNALAPAVLLLFVVTVMGGRLTVWEKGLMTIMALLGTLFLLPAAVLQMLLPSPPADQMSLIRLAWLGTVALGGIMVIRGLLAAYHGFRGGTLIALAAALPLAGSVLSQQTGLLPGGFDPILIGIVLMILLFLFAVAGRYFELTQRLQALAQHMTNVQAMERQRLSRDLHDSLGQNLVSFQLNLKMVANKLHHPLLTGMLTDIGASIRRLDDTLHGLRPIELTTHGLCRAVERHCRRVQDQTNVEIRAQSDCPENLSEELKENLFHIFQEALNNCVKHARASRVEVQIARRGGRLKMTVSDDGAGFDAQAISGGLGMLTMRERAQLIGARFFVHSTPGQGTTISVEAPLND